MPQVNGKWKCIARMKFPSRKMTNGVTSFFEFVSIYVQLWNEHKENSRVPDDDCFLLMVESPQFESYMHHWNGTHQDKYSVTLKTWKHVMLLLRHTWKRKLFCVGMPLYNSIGNIFYLPISSFPSKWFCRWTCVIRLPHTNVLTSRGVHCVLCLRTTCVHDPS